MRSSLTKRIQIMDILQKLMSYAKLLMELTHGLPSQKEFCITPLLSTPMFRGLLLLLRMYSFVKKTMLYIGNQEYIRRRSVCLFLVLCRCRFLAHKQPYNCSPRAHKVYQLVWVFQCRAISCASLQCPRTLLLYYSVFPMERCNLGSAQIGYLCTCLYLCCTLCVHYGCLLGVCKDLCVQLIWRRANSTAYPLCACRNTTKNFDSGYRHADWRRPEVQGKNEFMERQNDSHNNPLCGCKSGLGCGRKRKIIAVKWMENINRSMQWVEIVATVVVTLMNGVVALTILSGLWQVRKLLYETSQNTKLFVNSALLFTLTFLCLCASICVSFVIYFKIYVSDYPQWVFGSIWQSLYAAFLIAISASLLPDDENEPENLDTTEIDTFGQVCTLYPTFTVHNIYEISFLDKQRIIIILITQYKNQYIINQKERTDGSKTIQSFNV
eukprot:TRINITY_DN106704_c0_g1_i1.p1 TRINITY_DN106704_c0_g1~~TRINITY_DN106704_c0_g1_i1.p1  ORF type:complete len:439 (-),score=-27.45 TRINITY_DN106704_c0_g1_i1:685-2001(-)